MAISASGLYVLTIRDIFGNDTAIDLLADSIKVAAITNTHTPNYDTDTAWNATNEVLTPSGGLVLASPTLTVSAGTLVFDAADASWASQTASGIRAVRIFDDTIAAPVADPLLALVNFGADYAVTSGVFQVLWHSSGIFGIDLTP